MAFPETRISFHASALGDERHIVPWKDNGWLHMHPVDHTALVLACSMPKSVASSWHSTSDALELSLRSRVESMVRVDYEIPRFMRFLARQLAKYCYPGSGLGTMPLFWRASERRLTTALHEVPGRIHTVLHVCDFCVPPQISSEMTHAVYQDATLLGLLQNEEYRRSHPHVRASVKIHVDLSRRYYERMTAIFTFNEWTRQSLIVDYGVPEAKVHNVGFGIQKMIGPPSNDYGSARIVTVVRKGTEVVKGTWLLLKAFEIVRARRPDATLAIVGTSPGESVRGVECFEGFPRSKTIELLQSAALFAMPAPFEPNGMVYVEALACRTPILGLRRFAFPEFSGDGKFGFIVEQATPEAIAAGILHALQNPDRLRKMGRLGESFVTARYNWDNVGGQMIRALSRFICTE
jgi:glycosyltransferase involved in cell wall biosynthesis